MASPSTFLKNGFLAGVLSDELDVLAENDAAIAAETQKKQAKEAKSGTATFVIPKALIDPKVKPK